MRAKKQMRLYDIYRNIVTGEQSIIKGINGYYCKSQVITIHYSTHSSSYPYTNEEDLRGIVTHINKTIGNCRKPGPKRRTK